MTITQRSHQTQAKPTLPELSEIERTALVLVRNDGPLSRTALAEMLGVSRASITAIVSNLVDGGVLEEVGQGKSEGGRPPMLLDVNSELGYIVGVDIGATSVDVALANFKGEILERYAEQADVQTDPESMLGHICDLIDQLLARRAAAPKDVLGVGIGVPGPVYFPEGVLIAPPLMPMWEGYPIKKFVYRRFPSARAVVDNDVNIMALGERRAGAGVGVDNFLFIKVGTGIGCGIISQGEVYRGSDGCAGDVGHICVDYDGPICHCGNPGCLEYMAAGPAIATKGRQAVENDQSEFLARRLDENQGKLTSRDVGDAAAAGDRAANEIIRQSGKMIGGVLAGLVNFYNPRAIFIGGGVSKIGHQLLSAIRQATLRRATALSTRAMRIEYSRLGDDAGVMGAIWLAIEHVFAPA
ncbi:MAG: ROK family protein [Anaerolineales bacterium]